MGLRDASASKKEQKLRAEKTEYQVRGAMKRERFPATGG